MKKIRVHLSLDLIGLILFFVLNLPYALLQYPLFVKLGECNDIVSCYIRQLLSFYYMVEQALSGDLASICVLLAVIISILTFLNYGFRVFEYNDDRFCIRSMFERKCYEWGDIRKVIITTKPGAKWIDIVTYDNFYYGPYHGALHQVLKDMSIKHHFSIEVIEDPVDILSSLRETRREHGTRMMFFQP